MNLSYYTVDDLRLGHDPERRGRVADVPFSIFWMMR